LRKILEITSLLFIAIVITISAAGISMHKMSCLESGKVSVSLEKVVCCPDDFLPFEQTSFVPTCCEFDLANFKVTSFESSARAFKWIAPPAVSLRIQSFDFTESINIPVDFLSVPPLPVTERLALLCAYLI